jgi:rare lipoprotein A (peptidoglycan hydrolase)
VVGELSQTVVSANTDTETNYEVFGQRYHILDSAEGYVERGVASWYGAKFHGNVTASGERFDMYALTAAHRTLPIPTDVEVTNLRNGKSIVVRINDRGPFVDRRIIDLSYAAGQALGLVGAGTGLVEVRGSQRCGRRDSFRSALTPSPRTPSVCGSGSKRPASGRWLCRRGWSEVGAGMPYASQSRILSPTRAWSDGCAPSASPTRASPRKLPRSGRRNLPASIR